MSRILERQDIVGHRIREVLQSAWTCYPVEKDLPSGYRACDVFVVLDDDTFFELAPDDDPPPPISTSDMDRRSLAPAQFFWDEVRSGKPHALIIGQRIEEVVADGPWLSLGLLLENGWIVHKLGATTHIGPGLDRIWSHYKSSEFLTYWDRQPIAQFAALQAQTKELGLAGPTADR